MRVVVTGGRHYQDRARVFKTLDELHAKRRITRLAEGGATGADMLARLWARGRNVEEMMTYPYEREIGLAGGPIRNARMLDTEKPDLVVAFPGGSGTLSCTRLARERGIEVLEVLVESET